jgi:ABC-type sugar transport system substrate-binding protein
MKGISNVLEQHPEIQLVSNQAADWDSTKARNIAATVIQQHPDLCAIAGFWDVMDVGTSAAIKESGQDVYLLTQGGGNKTACDGLKKGTYSEVVVYHVPGQARDMANVIKQLLQAQPEPGAIKSALFTPLQFLTKDNITEDSCWSLPGQQ